MIDGPRCSGALSDLALLLRSLICLIQFVAPLFGALVPLPRATCEWSAQSIALAPVTIGRKVHYQTEYVLLSRVAVCAV